MGKRLQLLVAIPIAPASAPMPALLSACRNCEVGQNCGVLGIIHGFVNAPDGDVFARLIPSCPETSSPSDGPEPNSLQAVVGTMRRRSSHHASPLAVILVAPRQSRTMSPALPASALRTRTTLSAALQLHYFANLNASTLITASVKFATFIPNCR